MKHNSLFFILIFLILTILLPNIVYAQSVSSPIIQLSSTATIDEAYFFGVSECTPIVGDWNGDGKSERGIYKDAVWYIDYSGSGVIDTNTRYYQFGAADWTPVIGDWNGDKKDEIGVFQNGNWYLDYNGNGVWDTGDKYYGFGTTGWTPVVGKWTADGISKIGIYHAGNWYIDYNGDGQFIPSTGDKYIPYGTTGWTQLVGDWNGDGKSEIGIYKDAVWYLDYGGRGVIDANTRYYQFGATGWTPLTGDWNGDNKDKICVYKDGMWYLDWNGNGVWDSGTDRASMFGPLGWTPIVGNWNGNGVTNIGVTNGQQWYLDSNGDGIFTPVIAQFTASTTQGSSPLIVQFTDQSVSVGMTSHKWDFDGDDQTESTLQNPVYTYTTPGNYTIKLTITNTAGSDSEIKTNYIKVSTPVLEGDKIGIFQKSNSTWNLDYNNNGITDITFQFGKTGDIPVIGNWDKDGATDIGVFRPSNGMWYLNYNKTGISDRSFSFGKMGDVPVVGDWNRDGTSDVGVFRPSTGSWYLNYNKNNVVDKSFHFGTVAGDIPEVGDWNGDGTSDVGVFRPSTGYWYLDYSNNGVIDKSFQFGKTDDIPVIGDWNGDGTSDVGVFRPSTGYWYLDYSNNGVIDKSFQFGKTDDIPVIGDWNGDGTSDVGVFRPSTGYWYLNYNKNTIIDKSIHFGQSGDRPIVVQESAPTAAFRSDIQSGKSPLRVQFIDQSIPLGVNSIAWDFDGDGQTESTLQNPVYTYTTPGNYTVKLTVKNTAGSDSEIKTNYVKVTTPSVTTCLTPALQKQLDTAWDSVKGEYYTTFNHALARGNPVELYNIQYSTNTLLDQTAKCHDYTKLNELVVIYNSSYQYLTTTPEGYHEWICGAECQTGTETDSDLDPQFKGKEVELYSQQFMFLVSRTLNIIASMDDQDKTPQMKAFTKNFGPLAVESYMRWQPDYLHDVQRKQTVSLSTAGINDCISAREYWMAAGIVELLAANTNDPTIKISAQQRVSMLAYVHATTQLVQSRVTQMDLKDFDGTPVKGVIVDYGVMQTHPEYRFACYTGTTFPTLTNQCTAKTGWDINHATRFVQVFETLYHNRNITGESFPDKAFMTSLANEFVYGSSNKDIEKPLFTNYLGGKNGWYRVGFSGSTSGTPPYGLTRFGPQGGYGYWAEYNSDVGVLMYSLLDMIDNEDPFIYQYYSGLQWSYGKTKFLPTFAIG